MSTPPLPRGALRAALARARTLSRGRDDILAVGYGYKHSRALDHHGYGARPRLSIAFFVREKVPLNALRRALHLPRFIEVTRGGRTLRFPTDVEALGTAEQQSIPPVRAFIPGGNAAEFGTPGFFLEASNERHYLVTAGHVLFNQSPVDPWPTDEVVVASVGATTVGVVDRRHTYTSNASGVIDAGLVRLQPPAVQELRLHPWDQVAGCASLRELRAHFPPGGTPITARVFGTVTSAPVLVDKLIEEPTQIDLDDGRSETYAPCLLHYRSVDPEKPLRPGNSGAPLVTTSGRLLGIHVLGRRDAPLQGIAQAARSIVDHLATSLAQTLTVVPNPP